jgi:hypothetical protein
VADAHPAPRGRACDRLGVPPAPALALARAVWTGLAPLCGAVPRASGQPQQCAAPGRVVRPGAPYRGLCRDLRGLAAAPLRLAAALRAVAGGAAQARICGAAGRRDWPARAPVASRDRIEALEDSTSPCGALPAQRAAQHRRQRRLADTWLRKVFASAAATRRAHLGGGTAAPTGARLRGALSRNAPVPIATRPSRSCAWRSSAAGSWLRQRGTRRGTLPKLRAAWCGWRALHRQPCAADGL